MNIRYRRIVERMERYCKEIMGASERFGHSKEKFMSDYLFYNSCCMSLYNTWHNLSERATNEEQFNIKHANILTRVAELIQNVAQGLREQPQEPKNFATSNRDEALSETTYLGFSEGSLAD